MPGLTKNEPMIDDNGADRGNHQRIEESLFLECLAGECKRRKCDRGNHRTDIALEEVGTHTGDVTNVVTNVVGDGRRVAGIIFRDPRLNLADQVGADVGRLGVDASANTREQGDRRSRRGRWR